MEPKGDTRRPRLKDGGEGDQVEDNELTTSTKTASRVDTVREDLYSALAEIPDKMDKLCRYTNEVHRNFESLRKCADLVYVEILEVIECVIKELTANSFSKSFHNDPSSLSSQLPLPVPRPVLPAIISRRC
jgi:hypothetical protein